MKLSVQILIAFTIVIFISLADSYTNYLLSRKVQKNTVFLANSEAVIRNSTTLHKAIIEMQSGFRGYLLTSDSSFLTPYFDGLTTIPPLFIEQAKLIKEPVQASRLDSINKLHLQWLRYSKEIISAKKSMDIENIPDKFNELFETKIKKQVGMKLNDIIAIKFKAFDRHEYKIRKTRSALLMDSIERTRHYSLIFLVMIVIIGIGSTYYIISVITKRIYSIVNWAENISNGKFSVINDTRNDELTGLSASLNIMSAKLNTNIARLEKTNAELNQFAHVVSHDLKAPLRGIYNVIQWIEEDLGKELSPQLKKYLAIIPQRTQRMENLINGLLDYAHTRHKTQLENVDSNQLVHEIVEEIVPRNFTVKTLNLPGLFTERLKLQQVFTNLISNAVNYTTNSNGLITISCRQIENKYEFSVKDNGIGIDTEYHEKIFEIFQTLREKNEKQSTGIGLAIIKKILDDQDCTIKVISGTGEGSCFIFTWPFLKNQQHEKI
jgi:signal transduction histidine kinase